MAITEASPETDAPAAPAVAVSGQGWTGGTDHKVIGTLFVIVAFAFLLVGGVTALLLRAQLAAPDLDVVGAQTFRQLFTMHGVVMVFLFLLPLWLGLASAVVPLQVGATRLAFPRLHALSFWLFLAGGAMVAAAPAVSDVADVAGGWTLSAPLPGGDGPDLLILGLALVAVAAVVVAVNLVVTILQLRAPGLTMARVPLFSWSVLVSGAVLLLALPVLVAALLMLFVDRHYGGHVFSGFTGSRGGNPLLWPRLFWFAAVPTLWALLLPGLGAAADIVPVFARRRLASHARAMAALAAVGVLAFAGWGAEVPSLRRARPLFALGALAVLAPVASLVLNWLVTLRGSRPDEGARRQLASTPMLAVLGLVTVLAAGLGGGVVSALDAGGRSHANQWSVATQHLLFFGAATMAAVAALHHWAPKLWGRHLSDRAGTLSCLALVGGLHLAFLPSFVLAVQDMGARLPAYDAGEGWGAANAVASFGAAVVGLGVLVLVGNLFVCLVAGRGRRASADPWGGHTLEWATSSPPPAHNFDFLPEVRSEAPLLDLVAAAPEPPQ